MKVNEPTSIPLVHRFLPFLAWLPELRDPNVLRTDFLAGLTVALVLIPQSMAYAQLAGLPPYYGLYAAFLPPMVAALFGSSRQLATGPVAVVSLMTAAALEPIAASGSEGYIAYAILLALMVGIFQLALGLLRLGVLVNFLSHPVVLGFTNAAAIIIATSQLGKIFGVSVEKAERHYETVWRVIVAAVDHIHWPTFIMAVLAFGIMIVLKRVAPKLPNVLIAVAVTTILAWSMNFSHEANVPVSAIQDETVQAQVAAYVEVSATLEEFGPQLAKEEAAVDYAVENYGADDERTIEAREVLNALSMSVAEQTAMFDATFKSLRELTFFSTPEEDEGGRKLYQPEAFPENLESDGNKWHFTKVLEDGSIGLHAGGKIVGTIPAALPAPKMPQIDLDIMLELMAVAIAISLIGFMEAISIAKAMAARTRQRLDANQELIGQGLSNITGSIFQSYAVSGSFSRSAVNIEAGAITGFSSVVTGIVVAITLLFLTPLLYHLPQATLAAVIMMAVFGLINVKPIVCAWKVQRHDGVAALITFILTLALAPHLEPGILTGLVLSIGLYVYRTTRPRVVVQSRHKDGTMRDAEANDLPVCPNITVLRFDGSMYFANVNYIEDRMLERLAAKPELKYVIVDGAGIHELDATAVEALHSMGDQLKISGVELFFARIKRPVMETMERAGLIEHMGPDKFFTRTQFAIERAWRELGEDHDAGCALNPKARGAEG